MNRAGTNLQVVLSNLNNAIYRMHYKVILKCKAIMFPLKYWYQVLNDISIKCKNESQPCKYYTKPASLKSTGLITNIK